MNNSKTCSITLLNKSYEIKCPEEEAVNLEQAAAKINEQLLANKKKFKQLDDFQNLLLVALHISHELITNNKQQELQRNQVSKFISSLENKINEVVHGNPLLDPQTD